jgi:hypothetical protein
MRIEKEKEMFAHVERCAAGTQTQQSYCRDQGINLGTFGYWRKRYLKSRSETPEFITITSNQCGTPVVGRIEILYPDGSRLSCGYDVPAQLLRSLTGR